MNSNQNIILSVNGLSKKFCRNLKTSLVYGLADIYSELIDRPRQETLRRNEFWVLQDIGFEIRAGETLGLIGSNGAGKTTLLRIISGLIRPDAGRVEVKGHVAPLLALGAGFNPILTGRENIYANMSILGLSNDQIRSVYDEVVDFSGIGDAIDAPVQSYSTGMLSRLGFSCAVHTDPELLLIDEVLAVGDVAFREKCFRKLHELREKNTSFLLVSHSTNAILQNCHSAIYLKNGKLAMFGDAREAIEEYEKDILDARTVTATSSNERAAKKTNKPFKIQDVRFVQDYASSEGQEDEAYKSRLLIRCYTEEPIDLISVHVVIYEGSQHQDVLLTMCNLVEDVTLSLECGINEISLEFPICNMRPGSYAANIIVRDGPMYTLAEVPSYPFMVEGKVRNRLANRFYQPHAWGVKCLPKPPA